ncbi:MAG: hypothetical protein AAGB23_01030 [Pseudomonadota bacterium]
MSEQIKEYQSPRPTLSGAMVRAGMALLFAVGSPAAAQEEAQADPRANEAFFDGLRSCRAITDDQERLSCFDEAVGAVLTASEEGEVTVIDQEEARAAKRSLFGFSVPAIEILETGEEEKDELFETTIQSARYLSSSKARMVTVEGAVWELYSIPRRQRPIEAGDKVVFKPASMNTFFVRINGQRGVRGKRVQ